MASIQKRPTASGEIRWGVRYRDPDQRTMVGVTLDA